jgi:hypothetical protein
MATFATSLGSLFFLHRLGIGGSSASSISVRGRPRRGPKKWPLRLAEAEFVEIRLDHPLEFMPSDLFTATNTGRSEATQAVGDFLVDARVRPLRPSTTKMTDICLGDGLLGLARHLVQDAVLDQWLEATGIDHQVGLAAPACHGRSGDRA